MRTHVHIIKSNPAAFVVNRMRQKAVNHINSALHVIESNDGNLDAMMATMTQIREDMQQCVMIGLISESEYDSAASIMFDVMCGERDIEFGLPNIKRLTTADGIPLDTMEEALYYTRLTVVEYVNNCIRCATNEQLSGWKEDGWESFEEYRKFIVRTVTNLTRLSRILGIFNEAPCESINRHMTECLRKNQYQAYALKESNPWI